MSLPLAGVRVLDLSNVLAGPFCTYQLALLGASVLKIEHPEGGDLARRLGADSDAAAQLMGASFVAVNAGKESLTLNLKDPEGKNILRRLVSRYDVIVENFRPGVMERLDLGAEALLAINPKLVYCGISGFGKDGPMSHRPAYDQIIQGFSGVMSVTGDADSAPLRVGYPISDTVGGITAALAICAGVLSARTHGEGRVVDVSMLESTLATMGWVVSNYLNAGVSPTPMGNENFTAAPSGTFTCGDGLLNIAANENKQFIALCEVIGRASLAFDDRFAERQSRKRHRLALKAEIETALQSNTAAHWEQRLTEVGVPAGRVLSLPEALQQPQLTERGFVRQLKGDGSDQYVTRAGFRMANAQGAIDEQGPLTPAPRLSAHTHAHLTELGFSIDEIAKLHEAGTV